MALKHWNVTAKHADGTERTFRTTGNLPDEAAVKAHYEAFAPGLTFVSAADADRPAPTVRKAE